MTVPIRRGALYWIPDGAVNLPPTAPEKRNLHERRPFLVLSNDTMNVDATWPVVTGFPLTTSKEYSTKFDVELARGDCALPQHCWIQVPLLQPITKAHLLEYVGPLKAHFVEEAVVRFIKYTDNYAM